MSDLRPSAPAGFRPFGQIKRLRAGLFALSVLLAQPLAAQEAAPPICTRPDEVGNLLREWEKAGQAAGNTGDSYDNRDMGHSMLNLGWYPQLTAITYSAEEIAKNQNKGPALQVRRPVVLGNASMATPATALGSLPRIYYTNPDGPSFLLQQYRSANLYVYPEHQDFDPGENGTPGYGDLYPLNTPYLLISQGSSGSDQVFLNSVAAVLAAFRPEVKDALKRTGFLMPTVQRILRETYGPVNTPGDYLSGAAHPVVFQGDQLRPELMVRKAHELTLESIPPVSLIHVDDTQKPVNGVDFFEAASVTSENPHHPVDMSAAVCRVFRAAAREREWKIDAQGLDILKRPVKFHWKLLQGDPSRVTITPQKDGKSAVVRIAWHPRFEAHGVGTHRVDIGVFADNGVSLSPPAIFSCYMLPNEWRVYDDKNRVLEVDYAARAFSSGLPPLESSAWGDFLSRIAGVETSASDTLWVPHFAQTKNILAAHAQQLGEWTAIQKERQKTTAYGAEIRRSQAAAPDDRKASFSSEIAETDAKLATLQTQLENAYPPIRQLLESPVQEGAPSLHAVIQQELFAFVNSPDLFVRIQNFLPSLPNGGAVNPELDRLRSIGVLEQNGGVWTLSDKTPAALNRYHLQQLHLLLFAKTLAPGFCQRSPGANYADPRLTAQKPWRDIYHYDASGKLTGWTRWANGAPSRYLPNGTLLTDQGPAPVTYQLGEGNVLQPTIQR